MIAFLGVFHTTIAPTIVKGMLLNETFRESLFSRIKDVLK